MRFKAYKNSLSHTYSLGVNPTRALLESTDIPIQAVLVNPEFEPTSEVQGILRLCENRSIETVVSAKSIRRLSYKDNTNVIGVFEKYQRELHPNEPHIVIVNPTNTGNLGTIMRTMLAFGYHDLVFIRPAVDVFHPKVISSSVGSFFNMRFEYFESFEYYRSIHPKHMVYPFMVNGDENLRTIEFDAPYCLVFGNESRGLPESFKSLGTSIYIPQTTDIDSLNLGLSVGIALWQASKGS